METAKAACERRTRAPEELIKKFGRKLRWLLIERIDGAELAAAEQAFLAG